MSFLDDIFCQLCERFVTKEQWNKHLYSSRHLHKKVYGYTQAYFPNRRLIGDEANPTYWRKLSGRCFLQLELVRK